MIKNSSWFSKLILLILFFFSVYCLALIISRYRYYKQLVKERLRIRRYLRTHPEGERLTLTRKGNSPYYFLLRLISRGISRQELKSKTDQIINDFLVEEETKLSFLATTSGVAPFIGLLGTVVGITRAFWSIGLKGSASLLVLAPGLAEALITTIAGLSVAIPAFIAYHYFINKLSLIEKELVNLIEEVISRMQRTG